MRTKPDRPPQTWLRLLLAINALLTVQSSLGRTMMDPSSGLWKSVGVGVRMALSNSKTKSSTVTRLARTPAAAHASTVKTQTAMTTQQNDDESDILSEAQQAYLYPGQMQRSKTLSQNTVHKTRLAFVTNDDEILEQQQQQQPDSDNNNNSVQLCFLSSTVKKPSTGDGARRKSIVTIQDASSEPSRGGSAFAGLSAVRPLLFWENMVCGAISRSVAQTIMHPANAMKTILQSSAMRDAATETSITLAHPKNFGRLCKGAGANFVLSVPHGAINFAVLEMVRHRMKKMVESSPRLTKNADRIGPGLDFLSSAISTITCSIVSTPQMMITDNIMAGNYPNLPAAVKGLATGRGVMGFYSGWWPGLAGKIPSYALTWTFFQQLKAAQLRIFQRDPTDVENSIMGCIASATTVCLMIPMDTIKTRLVTQASNPGVVPYKGIADCAIRVFREEGIRAFYRGLPPRLVSVVPMIGIQFGVYEFMKKVMVTRGEAEVVKKRAIFPVEEQYGRTQALEETAMEVAADDEQPFPAPHFQKKYGIINGALRRKNKKKTAVKDKV